MQTWIPRSPFAFAVAVLTLVVLVLMFLPLGAIFLKALVPPDGRPALDLWIATFTSSDLIVAARNTLLIAVATTALAVPIGVFFAWLVERTDARWGALSRLLPVIPLLLPPVALTIGWLFLADPRAGFLANPVLAAFRAVNIDISASSLAIQSWPGLIFLYVLFTVPHVYVVAAAAFSGLDPSLEEAARVFGKGRLRCFFGVSVPAIRYAVGSSALLCVISSLGLYSIPALLGTAARIDVLSVYIYRLLNFAYPPKIGQAVVLGLAMFDVLMIDFSSFSSRFQAGQNRGTVALAFTMGAVAALLAGACVAPVVIQVVLFSSNLYATGTKIALVLPFCLGLGMAIPWPLAGAGLATLPTPGAWMVRVKQAFGVFILATAAYYGYQAYDIFSSRWVDPSAVSASVQEQLKAGWRASLADGLDEAQREQKPVLIDMWATWCKTCLTMDKTTLENGSVKSALAGYVKIKFQAEAPDEQPARGVMQRFGAVGLPTYVILRPKQKTG